MFTVFLIVVAVCIDIFIMSVTYGIEKIKIPMFSCFIVSFTGTFFLALSILFSKFLGSFIPPWLCTVISVICLYILGIIGLFQNGFKSHLRKNHGKKEVTFTAFNMSFFINIILDESVADIDNSKVLSIREAFMLGIVLSIDSISTGCSVGMTLDHVWLTILSCLIVGFFSVILGGFVGKKFAKQKAPKITWLSGLLLIILATAKLF